MNRCFVLVVDESKEQTARIEGYQAARQRGEVDKALERSTLDQLQNMIRLLVKKEVVNPFAGKISLPSEIPSRRRLNDLFLNLISLITWVHQYQRKSDDAGRLITELKDVESACHLLLGTLVQKADDLNSKQRKFFEKLKGYVKKEGGLKQQFTRLEVRLSLKLSKTAQHRFFEELEELEYIRQVSGSRNRGYRYEINYADDYEAFRAQLSSHLLTQLSNLS